MMLRIILRIVSLVNSRSEVLVERFPEIVFGVDPFELGHVNDIGLSNEVESAGTDEAKEVREKNMKRRLAWMKDFVLKFMLTVGNSCLGI